MKKILNSILVVAGLGAAVFSVVMLVMAVRYGELGRVMVYGILLILSAELAGFSAYRLAKEIKKIG